MHNSPHSSSSSSSSSQRVQACKGALLRHVALVAAPPRHLAPPAGKHGGLRWEAAPQACGHCPAKTTSGCLTSTTPP
jgi:hypothetical protein